MVTADGRAFLPTEGGDLLASRVDTPTQLARLARLGGRPIGLAMHQDGYLVVADLTKVHGRATWWGGSVMLGGRSKLGAWGNSPSP